MKKMKRSIQDMKKHGQLTKYKAKTIKGGRSYAYLSNKGDDFIGSTVDITGPPVVSPSIGTQGLVLGSFENTLFSKR